MYESFYGLSERPFNLTPDPRFLYLSEKHKEALAHLLYGIQNRSGFVMISGEIGTGKTTICRSLLNQLDPDTELAFIFNPFLSPEELLRKINEDFGIPTRADSVKGLIDELNHYLLDQAAAGKNCVLVIDEAQNLGPRVLEQVRLLSNLETETQKLLQIILIGQPELAESLELKELRQLNQRITARYHLSGLDLAETLQYIAYRLRVAGGRKRVRFTRPAVKAVYKLSGGTPRLINAICDRALLIGYTSDVHTITPHIVRKAAKEIRGEKAAGNKSAFPARRWTRPAAVTAFAAAAVAIVALTAPSLSRNVAGVLPFNVVKQGPAGVASTAGNTSEPGENSGLEQDLDSSGIVDAAVKSSVDDSVASAPKFDAPAPLEEAPVQGPAGRLVDSPDGFLRIVHEWESSDALQTGLRAVFRSWNLAPFSELPEKDSIEDIRAFAESNGMSMESLSPDLDQLLTINLPALVRVEGEAGSRWLAVLSMENEKLFVASNNGDTTDVTPDQFQEHYLGEAALLWVDPDPGAGTLTPAARGERVAQLQRQLKELGILNADASAVYDQQTKTAIIGIQRAAGLAIDGIAGKQTRMVLTSWLSEWTTPSLRGNSFTDEIRTRVLASIDPERPIAGESNAVAIESTTERASSGDVPIFETASRSFLGRDSSAP